MSFARNASGFCLLVAASACSRAEKAEADVRPIWERAQADATLETGRKVWRANCRRCHAHGLEGAPRLGDSQAWKPRAEKGLEALVQSALAGVEGKAGGEMPARGGNEQLSDGEVRAAVVFTLAALEESRGARSAP